MTHTHTQMQMQMQMQGYDMSHLDAAQQQQMMMMHGVDPLMLYGMEEGEEEAGEDGWLAPDSSFLNQQIQYGGQGGSQPWAQGIGGFEDDGGYGDDDFEAAPGELPEKVENEGAEQVESGKKIVKIEARVSHPSPEPNGLSTSFEVEEDEEISDASIEIGGSNDEEDDDADFNSSILHHHITPKVVAL